MRILMVNKFLYPRAGAETYMLRLSEALIEQGHIVAFFGMDHEDKTSLGNTYTVKKIEFGANTGAIPKAGQLAKAAIQNLTIKRTFLDCCKDFKPDIIHAHNVYNQLPPTLFHGIKTPVIMTAHDYKPVCPSYNLFSKEENCEKCLNGNTFHCLQNKCVQDSLLASGISAVNSLFLRLKNTYNTDIDYFIAPSNFMKTKLIQGGIEKEKINVIHNFTGQNEEVSKPGKNLLYAGRICKEKGVDTLIEAYAQLPEPRPKLVICGTGPIKKELERKAEQLKLNIDWRGYVAPDIIKKEMHDSMAVIVPSKWNENCSMTIMESLALGRPVIASNAGGNPELITPGHDGDIFQADNPQDLSSAIQGLISKDLVQLSQNAAGTGLKYFSVNYHVEQILDLYKSFLSSKYQCTEKQSLENLLSFTNCKEVTK